MPKKGTYTMNLKATMVINRQSDKQVWGQRILYSTHSIIKHYNIEI